MRSFRADPRAAAVMAVLSLAVPSGGAAVAQTPLPPACARLVEAVDAAVAAEDLQSAVRAARAVQTEPACRPEVQVAAGRGPGLLAARLAVRNFRSGQTVSMQEPILQEALRVGEVWQVLDMMGQIRLQARDYAGATVFFQRALNDMNDATTGAPPPPEAVIRRVHAMAAQSQMLAPDATPPRDRTGRPGGLGLASVRNVEIRRVPQPIQFEFGSARMTPSGERAAERLLDILIQQAPASVTLVGHTDPVGSPERNVALSLERARAVKQFLESRGFRGEIRVEGRGPNEPLEIIDPDQYTEAQRHQMLRRVELVR
jgi:OOP family OmpA-OmpF porin